ncbi:MAG: glycosyltransferase family 39 protein [Anaerolineae bacterium]|nr:glycosyltransferase family 39 protein [Anaerolineae bacterium]
MKKWRGTWLGMVIVLLLAFGLRMVRIAGRALWYDEAFAILYASLDYEGMIYGTVTPVEGAGAADVHPLLYYFSLHAWIGVTGQTPFAARFFSVVLGMVTMALLWRLAAWCFDRRVGLVVGLLAAANPFHVAYSQEARMYALLGLAAVIAAWGLLRALSEGKLRWWALYAVGAALTLYAHNLGAFAVLALNLLSLVRRRWWCRVPALILADAIVLALFAPWLIGVLPGQLGFIERAYWLGAPGANEAVRTLMLPVLTFYEVPVFWLLWVGLFVSLVLLVLLILQAWRLRARAGWFLLLCWVPVVVLFTVAQWRPVYLERALLPSALFYLVAVGWLLARGGLPRLLNAGLAALLIVTVTGSLVGHYAYARFPRPPFREAVAYLRERVEPDDAVVHTNKLTFFPVHVYAPDLAGEFLADRPGSPEDTLALPTQEALGIFATPTMAEAVGAAERVWLIYFTEEMEQVEEHPALAWLEGRFVEVKQERFNDLVVALYRREGP